MNSQDIRQSFLEFFRERGHLQIASSPIVPHGDPTLMFTNAGMVQFKDVFLGLEEAKHPRAVTVQKCLRVSGKHNDLENVGPSRRHHTFFEMLGNFSFGDYFKEDAISFGWDLVTRVWGLPSAHLFASVFEEDDEAARLWAKISDLPAERIVRCGAKDNFWAMGETGPCGPCSEIFVDLEPDQPKIPFAEGDASGRYLEIWNLVFMQFERDASGKATPLPNPSIDTGAGLERVTSVLQGVKSNYDTDLFQGVLRAAASLADTDYGRDPGADVSLRVIADHLRATAFLLADGVIPGPDGRGYVLRRLLRRAVRHGMRIGLEEPFLHRLVPVLDETMGSHYRELAKTRQATEATVLAEEEKYLHTRAAGARRVQEAIDRTRAAGRSALSGDELFQLYDTYGQELEAVREIAEEEQLGLDETAFAARLENRRETSRAATSELQKRLAGLRDALAAGGSNGDAGETVFEGYDLDPDLAARVLRLAALEDGESNAGQAQSGQAPSGKAQSGEAQSGEARSVGSLTTGQRGVAVLDRTPFYAESGGQVGDRGILSWDEGRARITDTQKDTAGTFFHFLEIESGTLETGTHIQPQVDLKSRRATERNHTATHLLHAALHQIVGEGARQAGSLVTPDRLRFDFTHNQPLSPDELRRIEDLANTWIRNAVATDIQTRDYESAIASGAMALFGEKYGDSVRTVEIPGFSLELCGGCHVRNSGEIGLILITSERGVASGVRRIEAITGEGALDLVRQRQALLTEVERHLSVPAERAGDEVSSLRGKVKQLEVELAQMRLKLVSGEASDQNEIEVEGIKVIAREVPQAPTGELRNLADSLRDKLGSGVVVLASSNGDKVTLIATVSKDLTGRVRAGNLVKSLATIVGGRGGGRPDFAQAGGRDPEKLPELLAAVPGVVGEQLTESSS